jgi:pyruvate dehydrogenase E1 component alpha subunit
MAELFGKETGCTKGKGGSMHYFSKEHNFYGGHGIVGAQVPLGAGMAFADKYNKTGRVTVCFFGDGAMWQGAVHETFNMASLWKLPVVFICENNGYAMGTSVKRSASNQEIWEFGKAYEMPCKAVDGMSVEEVYKEVSTAVEHARKGNGPSFLEIRTYRYKGHSMSDPQKYRTKEEVEEYKLKDPIEQVRKTILDKKYASDKDLEKIDDEVKQEVDACVEFAENSNFPDNSELYKDIYKQEDYPFLVDY